MKTKQGTLSEEFKQVIVHLIPTDEHHLLLRLEEELKVTPKNTPSKSVAKKAIEGVFQGMRILNPRASLRTYLTWTTQSHCARVIEKLTETRVPQYWGKDCLHIIIRDN